MGGRRTGELVGRSFERERLAAALEAVRVTRQALCVAVSGEPGIGKSRLLLELDGLMAEGPGEVVALRGRAAEFEEDAPFAVFVEAIDAHLEGLDRRRLRGLEGAAELAAVFPSLADLVPVTAALAAERYRIHRAVRELLERLAATRPVVIALDDLHWADPASLELLGALLRRPPAGRVLLVLAYRTGRLPPRIGEAITVAEDEGRLDRLELAPLDRDEVEPMLLPVPAGPSRDELYRESGGNPFYLEQLLRGPRRAAPVAGTDVPVPVAEALAGELAELEPEVRQLLEGAAVAGEPFEIEVAAVAADMAEDAAFPAIDRLAALGLVRTTEVPRRFAFRHPLVRRAVYEGAGSGWRLAAHARVADDLARRGEAPEVRAHHVEHSARAGDEAAVLLLTEAGAALARRAPATAAHWYRAALRLLPGDDGRRAGLLEALANAEGSAGRLDASRSALTEALAIAPGDPQAQVRLTAACAAVEHWMGRHGDARRRLEAALRRLGDDAAGEVATLRLELGFNALYGLDLERSEAMARAALSAARSAGDAPVAAAAGALLALGLSAQGRRAEAETERLVAAHLLAGLGALDADRVPEALWYLAWTETFLDRYEEAIARSQGALERSRAGGQGRLVVPLLLAQVFPLEQLGRVDEAVETSALAVEAARLSGIAHHVFWALWEHAVALIFAGRLRDARAAAEESLALSAGLERNVLWEAEPHWALAGTLLELGDHERGRRLLLEGFGGRDAPRVVPAERAIAFEMLAQSELACGDVAAATAAAAACERHAGEVRRPLAHVLAGRAQAAVLLAGGRPDEAADRARAAVETAEAAEVWLEGERTRILLGLALATGGDRDGAIRELRTAESRLGRQGARAYRDAASRELRRLGHRVERPSAAPGTGAAAGVAALDELSAREREVAALAADGRTNQQIADALIVSRKTVETHLRTVFRKLGVASRVELVRVMLGAGEGVGRTRGSQEGVAR